MFLLCLDASMPLARRRRFVVLARPLHLASIPLAVVASAPLLLALHPQQADAFHDGWRWVRFTTADGLPAGEVAQIEQTGEELWALTREGLAWYDGWRWRRVGADQELESGSITWIACGEGNELWVATLAGLFRGNSRAFRQVEVPGFPDLPMIDCVAPLADGSVIVSVLDIERATIRLASIPGWSGTDVSIPELPGEPEAPFLWQTTSGGVWLNTSRGLFELEGGAWRERIPVDGPRSDLTALAENGRGNGFAGFRRPTSHVGLWEWSEGSEARLVASEGLGLVDVIEVGPHGEAIVFYESGEVRVRFAGEWRSLDPVPEAFQTHVQCASFTTDGHLWVGTGSGLYLIRLGSERWTRWKHDGVNAARNRVNEVVEHRDGTLWSGSAGGVEAWSRDGKAVPIPPLPGDPIRNVTGLAADGRGIVWASSGSSFAGLWRWNGSRWTGLEGDSDGVPLGLIHKIRADRAGRLWLLALAPSLDLALDGHGAVHYLEQDRAIPWTPFRDLGERRAYDFVETRDGAYWFATSEGISRWRDGGWVHWSDKQSGHGRTIRLADAGGGAMWFAQAARIGRIEVDGATRFIAPPGGSRPAVADLALGAGGALWITSRSGLHRYGNDEWSSFDTISGLRNLHLWPVIAQDERVVVGSLGGGIYTLSLDEANAPAPRPLIESCTADGEAVLVRWHVNAWQGEIPQERIPTRHRLVGGAWSEWSTDREVTLTGLSTGAHEIEIQARGLFGAIDPNGARKAFRVELPFHRRPGFVVSTGTMLLALVVLSLVHRSRRRRDALALRKSEIDHRLLMEQASDAIFIFDTAGRCLEVNSSASELVRRSKEECRGMSLFALLSPPPELLEEVRTGHTIVIELEALQSDGRHVPVEVSVKLILDGRIQAIVRDLTERRRLEHERLAMERRLTEAQKLESLGLLASGVAHDFNNLLTVIKASAGEALERIEAGSPILAQMDRIVTASQSASEFTNQLLAYAGRGSLRSEPIDLNAILRRLASLFETSLDKDVTLVLDLAAELPAVEADAGRLQQVVLNLILNASEAIGDDTGEIRLSTRRVEPDDAEVAHPTWAEVPPGRCWVKMQVADTGAGMDEESLARIFEPFYTTKPGGRGLGLAAAQGIVRSHGGFIRVESGRGTGTTFSLLLPGVGRLLEREPAVAAQSWSGSGRALVVDDEKSVREVTASILRSSGYEVLSAPSGREAIDAYLLDPGSFSLILLDQTMPGLTGTETMRAVRSVRPDACVILMSGNTGPAQEDLDDGERASAYLRKPFSVQELRALLQNLERQGRQPG